MAGKSNVCNDFFHANHVLFVSMFFAFVKNQRSNSRRFHKLAGVAGLGSFAWNPLLALLLELFHLGTLTLNFWFGISPSDLSSEILPLQTLAWGLSPGICRLGSFA